MKRCPYDPGRLAEDLAGLPGLNRKDLIEHWRDLYGNEPPRGISQQLLLRAVAYKMQERVLGGLKPSTRRLLAKIAEDASAGRQTTISSPVIKPGTRLLREWHGLTHEVVVLDVGVQFQGKQYRSLSEVARLITGTRWSGPLFFGLKAKPQEHADGSF